MQTMGEANPENSVQGRLLNRLMFVASTSLRTGSLGPGIIVWLQEEA